VPSLGATNSSLKRKQVKLLSHTPFTQNSKQSVSYLLSLKSWPPLVPVDWNHRGKGHATLDTLQDLVGPLWRMRPCWLLTLTTLGLLNWSENLAWIYISFHQSEGLVHGSTVSFSHLEGDPGIISRVCIYWFQGSPQAAEPGSGDLLPNGAQQSDPTGASRNVAGRMLDQREQNSNPGGWRKGRFIMLESQHLDLFKMVPAP
jgi:hypothetical protein